MPQNIYRKSPMKAKIFLLVNIILLCALLPLSAKEEASKKDKHKSGIYALTSVTQELQQWQRGETFAVGIFHNYRLIPTLYYQPELSYLLSKGEGHSLQTHVHIVPLQLQFGLHLGLIRPFVSAGLYYHFSASARDASGANIHLGNLEQRSSYGYFYGGGIDLINTLQLFYRQQNNGPIEHQVGLSLIF